MKKYIFLLLLLSVFYNSEVKAHTPPTPNFSAINICFGDTVNFINQSIGGVYFTWYIQSLDTVTNTSTLIDSAYTTNLNYLFPTSGYYIITLVADNGHVVDIAKQIWIGNTTKSKFDFIRCVNQFVNISTCASSFHWDFGDNTTDTTALPIHTYTDTGHYVVTLIASNGFQSDTLSDTIFVDEIRYPNASVVLNVSNDTLYGNLLYPIGASGFVNWYFDDGTTASTDTIVHKFDSVGVHTITVRVVNGCGMIFQTDTFTITGIPQYVPIINRQNDFYIYPNPAKNNIRLRTTDNSHILSIEVYDLIGQLKLKQQNVNSENEIDISSLSAGQYILRIQNDKKNYNSRFTKE